MRTVVIIESWGPSFYRKAKRVLVAVGDARVCPKCSNVDPDKFTAYKEGGVLVGHLCTGCESSRTPR